MPIRVQEDPQPRFAAAWFWTGQLNRLPGGVAVGGWFDRWWVVDGQFDR
jgi:hypothetical protein